MVSCVFGFVKGKAGDEFGARMVLFFTAWCVAQCGETGADFRNVFSLDFDGAVFDGAACAAVFFEVAGEGVEFAGVVRAGEVAQHDDAAAVAMGSLALEEDGAVV